MIGELDASTSEIQHEEHETAPAYGEPTDHTNSRWPTYSGWDRFSSFVGLHKLMFDPKSGLMRSHPGCTILTNKHKEAIDKAYDQFYINYPDAKPTLSTDKEEDQNAIRLEWLKYWVDWSINNHKKPRFFNS